MAISWAVHELARLPIMTEPLFWFLGIPGNGDHRSKR
jgi:hypothetical protein